MVAGTLSHNRKAAGSATQQDADQGLLIPQAFGGNNTSGPIDVSPALRAHPSPQFDFESDAFVCASTTAGTLTGSQAYAGPDENDAARGMYVAHTLRGAGFDASEDGTGRGTPLVAFHPTQDPISSRDTTHAVGCGSTGGQSNIAVALALRGRDGANMPEVGGPLANALRSSGGGSDKPYVLAFQDRFRGDDGRGYDRAPNTVADQVGALETVKRWHVAIEWMVRRLTPRECERLQGLPDDYTLLTHWSGWRYVEEDENPDELRELGFQLRQTKKTKRWRVNDPDGPRYKVIGNGMAKHCIEWVLCRVNAAWVMAAGSGDVF